MPDIEQALDLEGFRLDARSKSQDKTVKPLNKL